MQPIHFKRENRNKVERLTSEIKYHLETNNRTIKEEIELINKKESTLSSNQRRFITDREYNNSLFNNL